MAEIRGGRVRVDAGAAAALVIAAIDDGLSGSADRPATARDAADLLRVLLGIESRPGAASPNVPGALLVLLARAAGQIDLPPLSLTAFRDGLRRFADSDPRTLGAVSRRASAAGRASEDHAARSGRAWRYAPVAAALVLALAAFAIGSRDGRQPEPVRVIQQDIPAPVPADTPRTDAPRPAPAEPLQPAPLLSADAVGADVFSPSFIDGDVFFHTGRVRSALMRASFEGGGRPALTTVLHDGASNYHVAPSPDGRWIAFDSDREGVRGVYVAPRDFRDPLAARRISGPGYAAVPRWSPDGRRLAFVKAEAARPRVWNVWVADLADGRSWRVSRHRVGQSWGPSWLPDGQRLVFSVEDRLVLAGVDGTIHRVLPSPRAGSLIRTPAVSPDGRRVVFQARGDGVWLLDLSTGRMEKRLDDRTAEEFAWSPDGRRIVYHARRGGAWSVWQLPLGPA